MGEYRTWHFPPRIVAFIIVLLPLIAQVTSNTSYSEFPLASSVRFEVSSVCNGASPI